MKNTRVIRLAMLLLLPCMLQAQASQPPAFVSDSLDAYIMKAMGKWDIPGLSVAIVKDGKPLIMKGYGFTEKGGSAPVDENTLFMVASNIKAFTGTALALLEYDRSCSLDDRVQQWLPEFRLYDPATAKQATLRDLLAHNLGYATFQGDFLYFYSDLEPTDIYRTYAMLKPPFSMRIHYGYSNIGYFFAGECIEKISGMPWHRYLQERILDPLQMDRTRLVSKGLGDIPNVAAGHTHERGVLQKFPHAGIDLIGAAAGMSSSAHDLSNWLTAQLANGRFNNVQAIPEQVISETRKPVTISGRNRHPFNRTHYDLYGLGWAMEDYEGVEVVSHSGGIWGFVTGVSFVPELGLGIVILTNSDENWFYEALKWEIIDAFLGLPYRNYSDLYHSSYELQALKKKSDHEKWAGMVAKKYPYGLKAGDYEGTWRNDAYGTITLKRKEQGLEAAFEHHPGLKAYLLPLEDDTFLCTYTPSRFGIHKLSVTKSESGTVTIHVKVADRLDRGEYEFTKTDTH